MGALRFVCLLSLLRFEAFTPIDFIALRNETRPTLHLRSTIRLVVSDLFPSEMPASLTKLCSFFFVAPRCAIVMSKLQLSSPIRGKCRGSSPKHMKYGWYDLHRGWLIDVNLDVNSVLHSNPLNPLSSEMEHPRSERQSFRIPESHWKA